MAFLWAQIRRRDFPLAKKIAYLDHASGGPIPRPVLEKIKTYYSEHFRRADLGWPVWIRRREEVRARLARFINADPEEVAFIHSTSQGMNHIAELLAPRGAVLTNTSEFPSSTLPWLWRKARVIWQKPEAGSLSLEKLKSLLKPSVKTLLTSFVQYATGFRQDLAALGGMKAGRYLAVNATQAFGALKLDVKAWKADFVCANSYKWLMAGYGAGFLYVRKPLLEKFKPLGAGWRSMARPELMDNRRLELKPEASRYEPGCPAFPNIFALGAAVEYLDGIGIERIEKRILELTDFAIQKMEERGFEILSPKAPESRSGIVIVKIKNPEKVSRRLLGDGIYVSARGGGIRLAPHFYNTFEEIDRFVGKLVKHSAGEERKS